MTLHLTGTLLRVIPLRALAIGSPALFRGSDRGRVWALTAEQLVDLREWAAKAAQKPARNVARPAPTPRTPKGRRKAPAGSRLPPDTYFRQRAKVHPVAVREVLNDCDYLHKLNPSERAFYEQFQRETLLNRWFDKQGVEALYPRGSKERKELQFLYNRRRKDISNHPEWWPQDPDAKTPSKGGGLSVFERLPADAPTENDIIDAIDRSRE